MAKNTDIRSDGRVRFRRGAYQPERVRDITSERLSVYAAKLRKAGLAESTIASHLAHLRAALPTPSSGAIWPKVPTIPRQQRVKVTKAMKGRPITLEEFERMLASVEAVVGADAAPSWKRLLQGLWHSGLRLSEALALYWDRGDCPTGKCLEVDLSGRRPMLVIPASLDKGGKDRVLPMAPSSRSSWRRSPEAERTGPVFAPEASPCAVRRLQCA